MANQALGIAKRMASKKMDHGGKCYACGGMVNPELQQSKMADGGMVEDLKEENEDGGVDEYNPESVMDADGDSDDLVYSPEVDDMSVDDAGQEDDGDNEAKRANFLKAYLIHRKVRKG